MFCLSCLRRCTCRTTATARRSCTRGATPTGRCRTGGTSTGWPPGWPPGCTGRPTGGAGSRSGPRQRCSIWPTEARTTGSGGSQESSERKKKTATSSDVFLPDQHTAHINFGAPPTVRRLNLSVTYYGQYVSNKVSQCVRFYPTNNALLTNFRLSSDAEILLMSID